MVYDVIYSSTYTLLHTSHPHFMADLYHISLYMIYITISSISIFYMIKWIL